MAYAVHVLMGRKVGESKGIRFREELGALVAAYAAATGRNFSNAVNWLVERGLKAEGWEIPQTPPPKAEEPPGEKHSLMPAQRRK